MNKGIDFSAGYLILVTTILTPIVIIIIVFIVIVFAEGTEKLFNQKQYQYNKVIKGIVIDRFVYKNDHGSERMKIKSSDTTSEFYLPDCAEEFENTVRIGDSIFSNKGDSIIKIVRIDTIMEFNKYRTYKKVIDYRH